MLRQFLLGSAAAATGVVITVSSAVGQSSVDNLHARLEAREVPVNVGNFVRAATDIEFGKYLALSGGVNQLLHIREPTLIEQQPTVRMNRDTLYSMALIDISEGATLSLPEMGERYVSAQIVNQDHFMNKVFRGGGDHKMDIATFDTPYVVAIIRTLVNASDPDDLAAVNALQDQMAITAGSAKPFVPTDYDEESFEAVLNAAKGLAKYNGDSNRTFGPKGEVDPIRYFLGAAFGWGGLPETEAFYLNVEPGLPVGEYKIEVPADVPAEAFWSVSLYNEDGRFEENAIGAYNVNSVSGTANDDDSMTVHLGGCDDGRLNCLPIMDGWNYAVRFYRPDAEVVDGSWTFPAAEPVK